jgi:hypothetical protein
LSLFRLRRSNASIRGKWDVMLRGLIRRASLIVALPMLLGPMARGQDAPSAPTAATSEAFSESACEAANEAGSHADAHAATKVPVEQADLLLGAEVVPIRPGVELRMGDEVRGTLDELGWPLRVRKIDGCPERTGTSR